MKRMICYFLLCALVLACIAGCITQPPVSTPTDPSGPASLENPTSGQTTQPTSQATQPQQTQPSGQETQPQPTEPGFTAPDYELEPLPTIDRETTGPLVEYDPDRELYILTSQNDIIYALSWTYCYYDFYIISKEQLDTDSISVNVPISHTYLVDVDQEKLGGVERVEESKRMNERNYSYGSFTYPMYLAYCGKDFQKLAQLQNRYEQLRKLSSDWLGMVYNNEITWDEYALLKEDYEAAEEEYKSYLNAEWEDYLALTKQELPQFYMYSVSISFDRKQPIETEESFTQIEVTIGDKTYVQDVGKVTLIQDWELPAPKDWDLGYSGISGILGNTNSPTLYNDGVHYIDTIFNYTTDRYELLEEVVMLNPALKIERVWLRILPKSGGGFWVEWDMSEPYEVYPGDNVVVYVTYRDENLNNLAYRTRTDAYLLSTSDGESFCRFGSSTTVLRYQPYAWYAIIFDGIDLESYYWDYYYLLNEPWRYDPEATPLPIR